MLLFWQLDGLTTTSIVCIGCIWYYISYSLLTGDSERNDLKNSLIDVSTSEMVWVIVYAYEYMHVVCDWEVACPDFAKFSLFSEEVKELRMVPLTHMHNQLDSSPVTKAVNCH